MVDDLQLADVVVPKSSCPGEAECLTIGSLGDGVPEQDELVVE